MTNNNPLLGVPELCARLNLKKGTLYSHLSRGVDLPPFFRIGSSPRWRHEDVDAWINAKLKEKSRRNFEEK